MEVRLKVPLLLSIAKIRLWKERVNGFPLVGSPIDTAEESGS